jgi:hypothetical protein
MSMRNLITGWLGLITIGSFNLADWLKLNHFNDLVLALSGIGGLTLISISIVGALSEYKIKRLRYKEETIRLRELQNRGPKGDEGKSAYQIWLDVGNIGTEDDFIASIKGDKGDSGEPCDDEKSKDAKI